MLVLRWSLSLGNTHFWEGKETSLNPSSFEESIAHQSSNREYQARTLNISKQISN